MRKTQSFILFSLGLLLGAFCYWLASISFFSRVENTNSGFRIIASSKDVSEKLDNCPQLENITDKDNIEIYCSFDTQKKDHGVKYRVRSIVNVKKDTNSGKVVISVGKKIKNKKDHIKDHITEAGHCDCETQATVDLTNIHTLENIKRALKTQILNTLNKADDRIDETVEEAYDLHQKKEELKRRIAKCEISKQSTVYSIQEIEVEEKVKCRTKQLADIKNSKERTRFFHSDVKKDLWYLAAQDEAEKRSLSQYIRELNDPILFDHNYFSVKSAIDIIDKYHNLRLVMRKLGNNKIAALHHILAQNPFYFHTDDNQFGRQDHEFLKKAWSKNFKEVPFPAYYSLSSHPSIRRTRINKRSNGISSARRQLKAIVNSPEFQKLYRQ